MKSILITGCSTGFGYRMAMTALARGYNVAATARDPTRLEDLADLPGASERLLCQRIDVTAPDTIDAAVAATEKRFGAVDVVVNNAGYGLMGPVEEVPVAEWRAQFETNLFGAVAMIQAVLPGMRHRGSGHIVVVSSISAVRAMPLMGPYCASKWALEGMAEALYYELYPLGLRVTIIEPGVFRTDFQRRSMRVYGDARDAEAPYSRATRHLARLRASAGSLPDPQPVAETILHVIETDNPPLRQTVGADVEEMVALRRSLSEAEFLAMMRRGLGLE